MAAVVPEAGEERDGLALVAEVAMDGVVARSKATSLLGQSAADKACIHWPMGPDLNQESVAM